MDNRESRKNAVKFTFSDGICLLCTVSRFAWHHRKQNEALFICCKRPRTRHFKHHWTFMFREETTHAHRNQSDSIHHAISDYVLHMHTLSCPHMLFLVVNQNFCFLMGRVCLFVECGCPFTRVSSKCQCCQCTIESDFFSSFDFKPAGSFTNRISFRRQPGIISTPEYSNFYQYDHILKKKGHPRRVNRNRYEIVFRKSSPCFLLG